MAMDREMRGAVKGEIRRFVIPPEEAYGLKDPDRVVKMRLEKLEQGLNVSQLKPGVSIQLPDGRSVVVEKVYPEHVRINANHPLAGEEIECEMSMIEVAPPGEVVDSMRERAQTEVASVSHILVETYDEIVLLQARALAGESFQFLAREASRCSSASSGGALGLVERGQLVPEMDAVVFSEASRALPPGSILGPVQTDFGWHLILLALPATKENSDDVPFTMEVRVDVRESTRGRAEETNWLCTTGNGDNEADMETYIDNTTTACVIFFFLLLLLFEQHVPASMLASISAIPRRALGSSEFGVHLAWGRPEDEAAQGIACDADVGEGSKDADVGVGDDDACAGAVLDGEFGFAILAGETPNPTSEMLPAERLLHVFHLEALDIQIVEPQQRNGVRHLKTKDERLDKVGRLLQSARVLCLDVRLELHLARLEIHTHIQQHLLRHWLVQCHPVVLQRRVAVRGHPDLTKLHLPSSDFRGGHGSNETDGSPEGEASSSPASTSRPGSVSMGAKTSSFGSAEPRETLDMRRVFE
eukprot:CAMPEP_0170133438 /NCGR_PEP_ID=MMETSP0033_2-20121228/1299_1 /TAXON_ID=195969 /ORGANISM="Dolichomastix tenuilepis, Strain CCMP3274" /LENGTH=529 /DNA_ID=CAMNT_0010368919 /DNA_START=150 /DNA_END=1741 /DNA_ORIENTATION=-